MATTYPPVLINMYLAERVAQVLHADDPNFMLYPTDFVKFFPASPTAIDDFTEQFPQGDSFYVYDRMMKMRRSKMPHIKEEQLLIYFYDRGNQGVLFEATQAIVDLLDREDESAEEVNTWVRSKIGNDGLVTVGTGALQKKFNPVYFHNFKIFQLEETADIIDFGTARTWASNKLIIDYKFHIPRDVNSDPKYSFLRPSEES